MKILLIEADPLLRGFWTEVFKKEGFQISLAEDETQAREQIDLNGPDLVFLGSNMEGAHGVHLMTELKSEPFALAQGKLRDLIVVAPLNTSSLRQKLQAAREQGAAFPRIDVERMTYAVKEALGLREASLFGDLSIHEMERQMIGEALKRSRGNQTRAARLLGISRFALRNRLKKYQLEEAPR
ncbi:MAG: response regulator [Candidatus Omnitrophica bacterium]|nr:response regulator [Candidatus Omnitrophota bacterium]